ncbi:Glutamine-dependent NAD(+) synthetase [Paraconexibacter sp. AEG42_29]|uniref:Glutamine-dependent NAD(+) synthetase n=1 Tax=Paraconexibacter sp. AEG42_29 TaxID=2997339 RepID=A0AAU7AV51_9ACTN
MRIALAQLNTTVGDLPGNRALIEGAIADARAAGAAIILVPELAITGYPPEDLLLKEHLLAAARAELEAIAAQTHGIVAVVGFPERADDVYNSAAVIADGGVRAIYRKLRLPNYGVFDELRYFQAGTMPMVIEVDGVTVGLTICEDLWMPGAPATPEALAGARLILNISASPFHAGKASARETMLAQRARDNLAAVAFCALVGGQDELVFDGSSVVVDHNGLPIARAPQFRPALLVCDVDTDAAGSARLHDTRPRLAAREEPPVYEHGGTFTTAAPDHVLAPATSHAQAGTIAVRPPAVQEVYEALVLGVHDYIAKNGFQRVVLGLSGGVDSTLVLLIAVDALGADRVSVAVMPSRYSSDGTQGDARQLAANLGVQCLDLPIEQPMLTYEALLGEVFAGREPDLTEENLQARIRGNLLMALSNKFGWIVLTTGNKSEMSVGYSTLYGDSAGGFAVIKDVPKTLVYELTAWRRARDASDPVPDSIVSRPPSAELRPDQKDSDSLPPYDVLDPILQGYVEQDLGPDALIARGHDEDAVRRIVRLVDLAEYKRRQQPPGVKITPRAFGRDRRLPITSRWRG